MANDIDVRCCRTCAMFASLNSNDNSSGWCVDTPKETSTEFCCDSWNRDDNDMIFVLRLENN